MWAHPATQANIATAQIPRRSPDRARGRRSRLRRVRQRADGRADGDPGGDRGLFRRRRAHERPARAGHQWPHSSRPSIPCASSPTARPASRAMPSPRRSPGAAPRPCWSPARPPSPTRPGSRCVRIETAEEMLAACRAALPADIAVCAAAVADWSPATRRHAEDQEGRGPADEPSCSPPTPTSWRRSPAPAMRGPGSSSASPPRPRI